ncbi:hypothetical protein [Hymenobacter sp. AT01-02]|uniref:hypothetical protein n=1 Tax=Hymenobacter sp. AT01-02 TaxID=1571877 RepID=UPI0006E1A27F|nr:hypothetical protein [Hymenobacter sp. AT01-02]
MFNKSIVHALSRPSVGWKSLATSVLAAATLTLSSCEKDQEDQPLSPQQVTTEASTLKRLLAMGFKQDAIVDKGDHFLVEGDIRFDKVTTSSPATKKALSSTSRIRPVPMLSLTLICTGRLPWA